MSIEPARILISRSRIAERVAQIGADMTRDLRASTREQPDSARIVLVPILTGSLVFLADLIRHIPLPMSIRPVTISSYPGMATSSQGANISGAVPTDLGGAHVVIVDDILDSGRTLGLLRRIIAAQNPASLRVAVLLRKDEATGRREEHVDVEYVGFDIGDEFVIGYGLDYDGLYRNLPDIGVLR
jgi:hypoxanthine phosphoribosyltransferase